MSPLYTQWLHVRGSMVERIEMASVSDFLGEPVEEPVLERQGGAYEAVLLVRNGPESNFDDVGSEGPDRGVPSSAQRQLASLSDLEARGLAAAGAAAPKNPAPARDLVNTYFAQ